MNFRYAAFTYLYGWICYDRQAMKVLDFTQGFAGTPEEACAQLVSVARDYGIIRNFPKKREGALRLFPVWEALRQVERPLSQNEAKDRVEKFVAALKETYEHEVVSAASKILWMRFGSPIVIYDSLTLKWMCREADCPKYPSYGDFYDVWQKTFSKHEAEIQRVCEELKVLSAATKFFGPDGMSLQEFEVAISSGWFRERVFDHALLNAAEALLI